ncbi:MAG TPA: MBL fold metallo-hydrolase [Chloroflexi bacterium]|jgi:hydroxyacylglutathione hydrolase|nr:MBL fold metallo-hydrolase [Chloroflexota bacterium]
MNSSWYDVDEILPGIWRVNDGDLDTSYVLCGSVRTGVIDTGLGVGDLAAIVAGLNSAPPLVINTHTHPDHASGNYQFADVSMTAEEWTLARAWDATARKLRAEGQAGADALEMMRPQRPLPATFDPATYGTHPLTEPVRLWSDGETIDLGGFSLEAIVAPAHTLGGLCLLDRQRRVMFTGDTVLQGTIWLHLDHAAAPDVALATYERLAGYADAVDWLLPAHGTRMLPGSFLTDLYDGLCRVWDGAIGPVFMSTFAGDGWYYDLGGYGPLFAQRIDDAEHA